MRAYIHTGVGLGTPTASQHSMFDSEKQSQFFLVLLTQTRFEPRGSLDLESDALSTEPPRHPKRSVSDQAVMVLSGTRSPPERVLLSGSLGPQMQRGEGTNPTELQFCIMYIAYSAQQQKL